MNFGPGTFALGYLAGVLSTLSPCVLPLLPILVATALGQHRFGPLALAAGLTLSFASVGLFIASIGAGIGFDQGVLRQVAAVLLIGFGVVLLSPPLQRRFTEAAARMGSSGEGPLSGLMSRLTGSGWAGQFAVGLVLGLIWSPCVGPTLGAATTLASQGSHLAEIAVLMLMFGLGAGTPLLVIGSLSREAMGRVRGRLATAGERGKWLLGAVFLAFGLAIVTGWDRHAEAWAVEHSPEWLTELTTRY